jgi:hypothetical protein
MAVLAKEFRRVAEPLKHASAPWHAVRRVVAWCPELKANEAEATQ